MPCDCFHVAQILHIPSACWLAFSHISAKLGLSRLCGRSASRNSTGLLDPPALCTPSAQPLMPLAHFSISLGEMVC
jgi:hypothetical protein